MTGIRALDEDSFCRKNTVIFRQIQNTAEFPTQIGGPKTQGLTVSKVCGNEILFGVARIVQGNSITRSDHVNDRCYALKDLHESGRSQGTDDTTK